MSAAGTREQIQPRAPLRRLPKHLEFDQYETDDGVLLCSIHPVSIAIERHPPSHREDRIPFDILVDGVVVCSDSMEPKDWHSVEALDLMSTARIIAFASREVRGGVETAFGVIHGVDPTEISTDGSIVEVPISVLALYKTFIPDEARSGIESLADEARGLFARLLDGRGLDYTRDQISGLIG